MNVLEIRKTIPWEQNQRSSREKSTLNLENFQNFSWNRSRRLASKLTAIKKNNNKNKKTKPKQKT